MLQLLVLLPLISVVSASQCMSTDCTSGTVQGLSGSVSPYLRVCCVIKNLGRSHTIKGSGITRHILCPKVKPKSCPALRDCKSVYENGDTATGNYTIYPDGKTPVEVYCNMEGINCDGEGGWTRVTYINMTQSGATCPNGLTKLAYNNIDHPLCGRQASSASCASTTFSSNGLTYSKVCGQVRGYQYGHNDALRDFSYGIDSFYVDGVSITYGNNPRQHIWTYIGGLIEDEGDQNGCPCNTNHDGSRDTNGTFIGTHYYCESGIDHGRSEATILYPDDPLWDGQQCDDAEAPCCPANSKIPWFYRSLDTQTSDDIELRVCSNRETSVENTPLDIIELYIK